jgi:hypothetical protein
MHTMSDPIPSPSDDPSSQLQQADHLLQLLTDDGIWARLVTGGLDANTRRALASELARARAQHRCSRTQREHEQSLGGSRAAASETSQDATNGVPDALACMMSTIRVSGGALFRNTPSLQARFAAGLPLSSMPQRFISPATRMH